MIILTQKGNEIIDTNRITGIRVDKKTISVYDDVHTDLGYIIAEYTTKERAEEVFKKIVFYKSLFEYYKYVDRNTKNEILKDLIKDGITFDMYEMPKK